MHRTRARLLSIGFVGGSLIALAACGGTGATITPRAATTMPSATAATPPATAASPSAAMTKPSVAAASPPASSTFTSDVFAVPVSFSLAGGWKVVNDRGSIIDISRDDHGASAGEFQRFTGGMQSAAIQDIGSTTVPGTTTSYVPWPKDLYAWLKSRPEFKPQEPQAITVGGRPATVIDADATVPTGTRIELVCSKAANCWLLDHNDRWRFVEVKNPDGTGVVLITNGIAAPAFDAYAQALDHLLGTLAFR